MKPNSSNKTAKPFFQLKGSEITPTEEFALELAHRLERPMIEWNHIVRLPNGEYDRVNRFDYNLTIAAQRPERYVQLASTAWIQAGKLTRLPETKEIANLYDPIAVAHATEMERR